MKSFYATVVVLVVALGFIFVQMIMPFTGNKAVIDTHYRFDHAEISMPDGTVVSGKVTQWMDYEGDSVQIEIDGKVYLTHYSRVVMIAK